MSEMLKRLLKTNGYWEQADDGDQGGSGGGSDSKGDDSKKDGENKDDGKKTEAKKDEKRKFTDDEAAELLKENMKRKAAEKKLLEQVNELQSNLKKFEGIDVDQVKQLLEADKDRQTKELEKKGEWDRLKAQMVEGHNKEKKELAEKVKQMTDQISELQSHIDGLTIGNAFAQSKFIADELVLTPAKARVVYGSHFEFKDGQMVGYDAPRGAKTRTMLVDASGNPLPFEEALKKVVQSDPDFDSIAKSKMKPGAGSDSKGGDNKAEIGNKLFGVSRISAALSTEQGKK